MMEVETLKVGRSLPLAFGSCEVLVIGPSALLRLLEVTYRRHLRQGASTRRTLRALTVRVTAGDQPPERALRDAHCTIAHDVARLDDAVALDAVVVERNGDALALIGAPRSGRTTLAVHLIARGWRLVGDANVFLDARGNAHGNHALMSLDADAIPHLPASFRPALERSRWHVFDGYGLRFYGIDPADAYGEKVWSAGATLRAVATLDGAHPVAEITPNLKRRSFPRDRAMRLADSIEGWFDG